MRFFNTAGPVNREDHYCIDPLTRFDLEEMLFLIGQKKYFILHAPRQTGKTSCMLALMEHLNQQGHYACVYCNIEAAQAARENVEQGINDILRELVFRAEIYLNDSFPAEIMPGLLEGKGHGSALNQLLSRWANKKSKPIVLIIDEIDSLVGDTLISVLRQLRGGYDKRPNRFPQTVILCGVRDIRDYRIHSDQQKAVITGGSAFNIKSESLRIGDFSQEDVLTLLGQHEDDTGQKIETEAKHKIWDLTQGQPWLVNALAYEVCFKTKALRKDRTRPITCEMIEQAKENLIQRRETHLDQLADKLQEERVARVVAPILADAPDPSRIPLDDLQYVEDLGLITTRGHIRIANPIYREVIPRQLTYTTQVTITHEPAWYTDPDGMLNMSKLLTAFQQFFREHAEHWMERFRYKEAGPQLLLQAFLQRILNSGGRVEREYGLGRLRTDLLVLWPLKKDTPVFQKIVIELKIRRQSLEAVIADGLEQTTDYMDKCGTDEGHLVIFDRREGVAWEEKIFMRRDECRNKKITVWGM